MGLRAGKIVDAICRKDGTEELVGLATVTLPDIENSTEEMEGLGLGKYEEVIGNYFGALTLGLKFTGISKDIKFSQGKTINLIIKAEINTIDDSTHDNNNQPLAVSVKGKIKKRTGGELGRSVKNEPEIEIALTYYKLEVSGEVIHEIDVFGKIAIIDGEDLYKTTKSLLS